jgi:hypothetical protein
MQEPSNEGIRPGANPRPPLNLQGSFLGQRAAPAAVEPPPAARRSTWTKVVFPVALFVLLVAGIAWVTQYLPSWRENTSGPTPTPKEAPLRFVPVVTKGDVQVKDYLPEAERGAPGERSFFSINSGAGNTELGLLFKSCTCARLEFCQLTSEERATYEKSVGPGPLQAVWEGPVPAAPRWQELPLSDTQGIMVPPSSAGLLRLSWKNKPNPEPTMRLKADLWMKPEGGSARDRETLHLEAVIALVEPVRLYPERRDLGVLVPGGKATAQFLYWSSTRDRLEVAANGKVDPCVTWEARPLTAAECNRLAVDENSPLRKAGYLTRVRSACRVSVTLFEERNGTELEMGSVFRPVPLSVKAGGEAVEASSPIVQARVRSEIKVLGTDEQGQVNLHSFRAADGTTQKVALVTEPKTKLAMAGGLPGFLEVKLGQKEATDSETTWELEVTVLPGRVLGRLEDTAVLLTASAPGRPPRRIRIPILGTAARD